MKLAERVVGFPDKWRTPIPTAKAKKSIQDITCSKIAKKAAKDAKKKLAGRSGIRKPFSKERPLKQKTLDAFPT